MEGRGFVLLLRILDGGYQSYVMRYCGYSYLGSVNTSNYMLAISMINKHVSYIRYIDASYPRKDNIIVIASA